MVVCARSPIFLSLIRRWNRKLLEPIHTYQRSTSGDPAGALESFAIGRSTSNQRIEAYWSHLVKDGPGWWINFFKDLHDLGNFDDSDPAHAECIHFCFMHIIKKELDQVAELWNQDIILSASLGTAVVHGVNLTVCTFCLTSTK